MKFTLVAVALVTLCSYGVCQQEIPANTLSWSAKIVLGDHSSGSGFYLQQAGSLYLVTAKHVLFDNVMEDGKVTTKLRNSSATVSTYGALVSDSEPFEIALDLALLQKDGNIKPHQTQDVVVVKIGEIDGPVPDDPYKLVHTKQMTGVKPLNTIKSGISRVVTSSIKFFKDVDIGGDVYMFGYPASLGLAQEPQLDYNKPLLRKGVVAGSNLLAKSIIIDCPSYFGNSGGPVMEVQRNGLSRSIQVIGVVVSYVPFAQQASSKTMEMTLVTNSGYSVVVPMDFVVELTK